MYPLLVNAIAATAGNLIDRWAQSSAQKATASSVPFQQMLDGAGAAQQSPAAALAAKIEKLRSALLASPEIRTAVDSSDPAKPVALTLSPEGTVSAQAPGQAPRALSLSPETAMLARLLTAALPAGTSL